MKRIRYGLRHAKAAATLGLTLTLTGCGVMNIGDPNYSCTGMPDGVQCMSTRDVYAMTNDGQVPAQVGVSAKQETGPASGQHSAPSGQGGEDPNDIVSTYVTPRLPDQPVPIRTPAQVMRVWIAPWEDDNGDLVVTGYLYTEIEPRRWVIGEPHAQPQPSLRPLQSVNEPETDSGDSSRRSSSQRYPQQLNQESTTPP